MHRSLDHNFMRANCIHAVEHALGTPLSATFHAEQRGAIVKHSGHPRAGGVTVLANRVGGHMLVSRAKRTNPAFVVNVRHNRALARNHPASSEWVQAKFSHVRSLSKETMCPARWCTRWATGDSSGSNFLTLSF
jgi:hypothetical protein